METSESAAAAAAATPAEFRSVLPHEPLFGRNSGDDAGDEEARFLHVQGSFFPKTKATATTNIKEETSNSEGGDNAIDGNTEKDEKDETSSTWTREGMQERLNSFFRGSSLRAAAREVHILDQSAPYTKIRLEYKSTREAVNAMLELKRRNISPSDILHISNSTDQWTFSSRLLQITLITKRPFLSPGWDRSSPPKLRRLGNQKTLHDQAVSQKELSETRFVWLSNMNLQQLSLSDTVDQKHDKYSHMAIADAIRSVVDPYDTSGLGVEVFLSATQKGKHQNVFPACYIGMRSPADAQALIQGLQGKTVQWKFDVNSHGHDSHQLGLEQISGPLFLDYAGFTSRSEKFAKARLQGIELPKGEMTRAECTSATAHVVVPGLVIVEEFCSEAQEAALMAVLTGPYAPWAPVPTNLSETGTMKRRVQHYGYVFDYKTADVLRSRSEQDEADCPAMPALPQGLGGSDRVLDTEGVKTGPMETYLNECVENGQGWEVLAGVIEKVRRFDFAAAEDETPPRSYPHLNQLTVNEYKPGEGIGSHVDTPSAFGDGLISLSLNAGIVMEFRKLNANKDDPESKKLVHLPRRSLLLMSGAARYEWEHMIVTRSTDMHNGEVLPRRLRVSLTLRTALDEAGSPMPLVQSNVFPPIWGHDTTDPTSLRTPACERDNVHAVYDAIAVQWHHTRGRRGVLWPGATQFLEKLEPGSIVADVGCGDGKYFRAIWNNGSYVIGTDISIPLLRTACFSEQTDEDKPDNRRVSDERLHLSDRPAVCAADCMSLPLRNDGCDAAICIAVLHHLSTKARRRRCIEELVRIVKPGGMINIQAWAITQEKDSRRKFAANDVYVPFNVQPKFLEGAVAGSSKEKTDERLLKSVAQSYSEAFNVGYDDHKGLVVFQRYCHLYRDGELEELLVDMANVEMVDSGFEAGNYFIILRVVS